MPVAFLVCLGSRFIRGVSKGVMLNKHETRDL